MRSTVVGGSASASSLTLWGVPRNGSELSLLSARPDGPQHNLLSLFLVAGTHLAKDVRRTACYSDVAIACGDISSHKNSTRALALHRQGRLTVSIDDSSYTLTCAWQTLSFAHGYGSTAMRLACGHEQWNAYEAIVRGRVHCTLSIVSFDHSGQHINLKATIPFRMESLSGLPKPVNLSACVDQAYHEGIDKNDFDAWAYATELVGFQRLYVPGQRYYRRQYEAQAKRGLVLFMHDMAHRYNRGRQHHWDAPSTFDEVLGTLDIYGCLCIHEHWYDAWVMLSHSTDEYFSFVNPLTPSLLPAPPTTPTPLVSEAIERYLMKVTKDRDLDRMPLDVMGRRWPCAALACTEVHWYSAYNPNQTSAARYRYEDPRKNASERAHTRVANVQFNSSKSLVSATLSFERRTRRAVKPPPHGGVRKCLVHPDYRATGANFRIHGFTPQGCSNQSWMARSHACELASHRSLRLLCWELCGFWGDKVRLQHPLARAWTHAAAEQEPCSVHSDDRYEMRILRNFRGPPSAHLPACKPDTDTTTCQSPQLERAHMRGDMGSDLEPEARWLVPLGPVVRASMAAAMAT